MCIIGLTEFTVWVLLDPELSLPGGLVAGIVNVLPHHRHRPCPAPLTGVTTVPPRPHLGHAPTPPTQEPALGILITPRVAQKIWNKCKLLFAVLGWTEFIQNNYLKLAHMNLTWVGREASLLLLLLVFILLGLECDNRNSEHCDDEPSHDWQRKYLVYIFSFHEIFSVYLFLYSCLRNWDVSPANQSVIITFISTTIFIRI